MGLRSLYKNRTKTEHLMAGHILFLHLSIKSFLFQINTSTEISTILKIINQNDNRLDMPKVLIEDFRCIVSNHVCRADH